MCSYSFYIIRLFFLSFFLFIALVSMHFASDVLFKLKHIIYEKMQIEPSNYQIENWSHTYLMIYYTFANSIDIGDLVVINDLNWSLSNLLADAIGIQNWKCTSNLNAIHLRYGWNTIPFPYNYLGIYNLNMWERHYSQLHSSSTFKRTTPDWIICTVIT